MNIIDVVRDSAMFLVPRTRVDTFCFAAGVAITGIATALFGVPGLSSYGLLSFSMYLNQRLSCKLLENTPRIIEAVGSLGVISPIDFTFSDEESASTSSVFSDEEEPSSTKAHPVVCFSKRFRSLNATCEISGLDGNERRKILERGDVTDTEIYPQSFQNFARGSTSSPVEYLN